MVESIKKQEDGQGYADGARDVILGGAAVEEDETGQETEEQQQQHSSSSVPKKLLSTSSPEGIQVASQITPKRLAKLLIRNGPLPIRHITSELIKEVPSFGLLSLSKQRRLIIAAMEQTDKDNNVVFEKIGWGQWAVRKIDSDFIVTEGTDTATDMSKKHISMNELRNQANVKLGWSKKQTDKAKRRESITNQKANLHNTRLPNEELMENNNAIESDSEDESELSDNIEMEDDSESSSDSDTADNDEDILFSFDHDESLKSKKSPPIQFAKRVPTKVSPPPNIAGNRRRSSSSNPATSITKIGGATHRHSILNRSRLNSLENLDNYILSSAKGSGVSINSPPPPAAASSALSGSPINPWNSNYIHQSHSDSISAAMSAGNRRKSSFNESHIRSTLSSSLPKSQGPARKPYDASHSTSTAAVAKPAENSSDTDEEDWATIGPESLRKSKAPNGNSNAKNDNDDEKTAAIALVDLMSV